MRFNDFKNKIYCFALNSEAIYHSRQVRFYYDSKLKIFRANEQGHELYFSNLRRGKKLYRRGIFERGKFIFSSYCLQNIQFDNNDVVIDCGANSGDLHLEISRMSPNINYIAIEPNPDDFEILTRNVLLKNKILLNKALGEDNSTLPFYVCTSTADSSLVEPSSYTQKIEVSVTRLDNLCNELGVSSIKLMKIEAEGYEPEILRGSQGILDKVQYVAADGGYERGKNREQTFTFITNFLLENNFEMIDIYFPWHRALFKNKRF